mmetsp:Transcript_42220/g.72102  ORF Transcript_42220/g.72102 Transcript_42220/m.72102 type:complete len:413 (+) Transcript_42220:135-1373(+)|eukprot:CAMPEP_0183756148 /NCGR_PEP_ID=MMETSP0739-20130205/4799_1 /TAXON_ID=385413 /ORGANISM="Thalassiosira miniscula, Strain CCMP1093" /LENGTH=412 /DNA_ID=CAMNT_0025993245 /DNA_START=132 /DNA_END=1370 /DNA_ORIENTATION=-
MNAPNIDALADVAIKRDSENLAAHLALSQSFSLPSKAGSPKLSHPNFVAAIAFTRPSYIPTITTPVSANMYQTLCDIVGSSINYSIHPSFLNEQLHCQSMADIERSAIASTSEGITMKSASIEASLATPAPVRSQAVPAAGISSMQSQFDLSSAAPSRRRKPNFAEKLHLVLNSKECRHAIAWLPSGSSFCIIDQEEFVKKILPKFFREAKFESFLRRLKRWGFRKVYTTGSSQTIFSHELFHRDRPDSCKAMNGRENATSCKNSEARSLGNVPASYASPVTAQDKQLSKIMMLEETKQKQVALKQQMNSIQNSTVASLLESSRKNSDTQAIINKSYALVPLSMPHPNVSQNRPIRDPSLVNHAKLQLTRLNDDIAQCEEQLAFLQRMKELKERQRGLLAASSHCCVSASSA